ncbi:recombinase family protein [Devosia sp. A369]
MSEQTRFRCAIYTRKSSEEGLDQDFNSIEAQREAGEAYIRSQAHEGWMLVPERYDDGGFSGGNMDRPALVRLMEAVRDGEIDIVVIYKIDRLTRSLTDFARLAETFDTHKVSFVSVTQQFNTTNSMGRLMLNVLLSFAQFEREITGERIRDKIAASKKKGMWMGGMVPMGYDVRDRRLLINAEEAETIRTIFRLYLEVGSVPSLLERLATDGFMTAPRLSAKGRSTGRRHFTRGHLYKLLSNPIYIGRVVHKTVSHPGQHAPIIDIATWHAVQAQLETNTQGPRIRRRRAAVEAHLLTDLLVASGSSRFIPTHANKGSRRYQYYVEEVEAGHTPRRLPAREIERAVVSALTSYLHDHQQLASDLDVGGSAVGDMLTNASVIAEKLSDRSGEKIRQTVTHLLLKVIYRETHLELQIARNRLQTMLGWRDEPDARSATNRQDRDDIIAVRVPLAIRRRGPQLKLAVEPSDRTHNAPDQTLLTAIVRARDWADRIIAGASPAQIAEQEQVTDGYVSQLLPLAFLAPSIIEDIVAGRHPVDFTADRMIWRTPLPLSWRDQASIIR